MIIRAGHLRVTIVPMSDDEADEMDCEGCYIPRKGLILIRRNAAAAEQVRIALHEITHTFYDAYGWGDAKLDQEAICSRMDWAWTNFMMDNRAFMQAMLDCLSQNIGLFGSTE